MSSEGKSHLKLYAGVFVALLALTFITVKASETDFGTFNTAVALGIACIKASLVILYFMHVRWSSKLTWVFAGAGFVFLVILLGFTLSDYFTRDWMQIYGPALSAR